MDTKEIADGGMWFEDDQWWEKISTVDLSNMRAQIYGQRVELKMLTEALKTLSDNLEWNREMNTVYIDAFEKFNILDGELAEEVIKAFLHVYPPRELSGDMSTRFVTVSEEAKQRLMDEHGLTEEDFK